MCVSLTVVPSFHFFSPGCTLHTAITRVISVLELRRLTPDYAIGIHVRLNHSNTFITRVISAIECNVQSGLKTLKRLYSACILLAVCGITVALVQRSGVRKVTH